MRRAAGLAWTVLAAAAGFAQQPRVMNARMETRAAQGDRQMCCYQNGVACGCWLEPRGTEQTTVAASPAEPIKLEGATHLAILFRVADPLVELARKESDPQIKKDIVQMLSLMESKEGNEYLLELLNK